MENADARRRIAALEVDARQGGRESSTELLATTTAVSWPGFYRRTSGQWTRHREQNHHSRRRREKGKIPIFFVVNTTHPFGHLRFTDFRETRQEYVNPCAGESLRSEILKIFRCTMSLRPKYTDVSVLLGEINSRLALLLGNSLSIILHSGFRIG